MKKILTLVSLLMPLCASSQLVVDFSKSDIAGSKDDTVELQFPLDRDFICQTESDGYILYEPRGQKSSMSKRMSTETFTVTFVYDYDPNKAAPISLTIYNAEQGVLAVDKTGKSATFTAQIPKGTYDMHAMFKGKPTGSYTVFKENVVIDKDTTLSFNKEEATIPFIFKVFDESGTQLSLDKYEGGVVAEQGNVNSYRSYSFFALRDLGVVHTIIGGSYRIKGYDVDFYMSPVSDRFALLHACNMRSKANNQTYFFKFETPLNAAATLESKPEHLKAYKQKFTPTLAGQAEPTSHIYGNRVWCTYNGKVLLSAKAENKNMVLENNETVFHIDLPEPAGKGFAVMVNPMMGDTYNATNKQYKHIIGLPVTGNAEEGLSFVDYGYDILDGFIIPVGGGNATVYPGNPALSWKEHGEEYIYGNNCPLLSIKSKDYDGKTTKLLTYLGRYGESYETYKSTVAKSQQADGEFIDETFVQENVKVDEMEGKNVTIVHRLKSGSDITAPSVQMLRFVAAPSQAGSTSDGVITDRLTAADGSLEFVAGDMQYHHDPDHALNRYYECKPISSVEVSCAKHGTDAWSRLNAEEIPEKYFMPGFGYFYRASLASLDGADEWYDLRIKLTDEVGNVHTQTLMPAFFIKAGTSGLTELDLPSDDISCEGGYVLTGKLSSIVILSLDGKPVRKRASGRKVYVGDLLKGIYLVMATDSDGQVLTKKIII